MRLRAALRDHLPQPLLAAFRRGRTRYQRAEARFRAHLPEALGGRYRPSSVSCRRLTEEDRRAFQALRGHEPTRFTSDRPSYFCIGLFLRGELVGVGWCNDASAGEGPPFRRALFQADYVKPANRRRALAQQLHAHRLRELSVLGTKEVYAWVNPENHASQAALRACGFTVLPSEEHPPELSPPQPQYLLFFKRLPPDDQEGVESRVTPTSTRSRC